MLYEIITRCSFVTPEEYEDVEIFREVNPGWREFEMGRFITFEKRDYTEIVFTEGLDDEAN